MTVERFDSNAYRRITEKMQREEPLTPEEQRLMAEAVMAMIGYLVHGAARLVRPVIDRLASPEFRSSLDELARRIDAEARVVDRHQRQIEAEHRED